MAEIISEAYELQNNDEKISAASGKDTLGITRGDKENTFVIHFSDSAMVSRAISRGYITVNGMDIELLLNYSRNTYWSQRVKLTMLYRNYRGHHLCFL